MACTGSLPPNTRSGQNFIHDPKLTGEREVTAQIKLRFYNSRHQPFLVSRGFKLAQSKQDKLTFKALHNTITTIDSNNKPVAVESRCNDINATIPYLMGVSKAILENVIFVHQEDSNWPLAEGSVLKTRFDDIFAATKYTKALDELKKIKTKQTQEVKELKLTLETLKTLKDQATKLKTDASEGEHRAGILQQQIDRLNQELSRVTAARNTIMAKLRSLANYGDDIVAMKAQHSMLAAKNAETFARLVVARDAEDLNMSIEELQTIKTEAESERSGLGGKKRELERELQSSRLQFKAFQDQKEKESRTHARLTAEAEAHERNVVDRNTFLCRIAGVGDTSERGAAGGASLEEVVLWRGAFTEKVRLAGKAVSDMRSMHHQQEQDHSAAIDATTAQINGIVEGIKVKEETVTANNRRMGDVHAELESLGGGIDGRGTQIDVLEQAQRRLKDFEGRLAAKEEELIAMPFEERSRIAGEELSSLIGKMERLRKERSTLAAASDEAVKMNFKAQELASVREKESSLMSRYRGQLAIVLGVAPTEIPSQGQILVDAIKEVVRCKQEDAATQASTLSELQNRLAVSRASLGDIRHRCQAKQAELDRLTKELSAGMAGARGRSVATHTEELEQQVKEKSVRVNHCDAFTKIFGMYCQYAREKNVCSTCERPFTSVQEREAFVVKHQRQIDEFPCKVASLRSEIGTMEAQLAELKKLQPLAIAHDALQSEIPQLQSAIAQLESEVATLEVQIAGAVTGEERAARAVKEAEQALQEAGIPLLRLSQEAEVRAREVDALKASLHTARAEKTVADVDAELDEAERARARLQQERDSAAAALSSLKDEVAALRSDLHACREDILRLRSSAEKRAALQKQLQDMSHANEALAAAVATCRRQMAPLQERLASLTAQRSESRERARRAESALEDELRSLQTQETQLEARERALVDYSDRGGERALADAFVKLETVNERLKHAESLIEEKEDELSKLLSRMTDSETIERDIDEMLEYQRSKQQETALSTQLEEKMATLANLGDKTFLEAEGAALAEKEQTLRSEADRAGGSLSTVKESIQKASRELRAPHYQDIDKKYRMQMVKLNVTSKATEDVEKFHKAFERALVSFHKAKMEDINKIIKELWQKTYRNSDIDYIQIVAEDNEKGKAAKSYNYRVEMVVGGTKLDMRGRCSAGQRVLACLIIRLALAETFCLNCGILALDEPTTNLDADNSQSLAEALKFLISARRDQGNFQLLVITHDETFARLLGTREYADHMWRITKDEDQHSTVTKEDIFD